LIIGIGIDLFDISRMYDEIVVNDRGFQYDVFTPAELSEIKSGGGSITAYASRFAAKEAALKSLPADAVPPGSYWRDIEIRCSAPGKSHAILSRRVLDLLSIPDDYKITISFSHTSSAVLACAALEY